MKIQVVENALEELADKITPETLEPLKKALRKAQMGILRQDITQEEVDNLLNELREAFENIEFIKEEEPETPVNKDVLAQTLGLMKSIVEGVKDKFTPESISNLEEAFTMAQSMLDNEEATQEEVDDMVAKLNEAFKALEAIVEEPTDPVDPEEPEEPEVVVNTEFLEKMIEKVSEQLEKLADKLTDESKSNLEQALAQARELLNKEELTQEEVDDEVLALVEAIGNVEFKEVIVEVEVPTPVNKDLLQNLVNTANDKLNKDLEEESKAKLQDQVDLANKLLQKEDASQEEIDQMIESLLDAIFNAKVKVEDIPVDPENPVEPENPVGPENPVEPENPVDPENPLESKDESKEESVDESKDESINETKEESKEETKEETKDEFKKPSERPSRGRTTNDKAQRRTHRNPGTGDQGIALAVVEFVAAGAAFVVLKKEE